MEGKNNETLMASEFHYFFPSIGKSDGHCSVAVKYDSRYTCQNIMLRDKISASGESICARRRC